MLEPYCKPIILIGGETVNSPTKSIILIRKDSTMEQEIKTEETTIPEISFE